MPMSNYTEGWPQQIRNLSWDDLDLEVVPLSDAERLREERDTALELRQTMEDKAERLREERDKARSPLTDVYEENERLRWTLERVRKWANEYPAHEGYEFEHEELLAILAALDREGEGPKWGSPEWNRRRAKFRLDRKGEEFNENPDEMPHGPLPDYRGGGLMGRRRDREGEDG
jgi:hypothetical protein